MIPDLAFLLVDRLGTAAFAMSGAMVACKKKADLFGIVFLSVITAMGGGMIRDVLLGHCPPALFTNWPDLTISTVTALLVFFFFRYHWDIYDKEEEKVNFINSLVDAAGLGMFAVSGCQVAIADGYGMSWFLVLCMGMTTACGGGLLRDIILVEIPFILTKYIYAIAAIAGSVVYCSIHYGAGHENLAMICGILTTLLLRVLARKYKWNLPTL